MKKIYILFMACMSVYPNRYMSVFKRPIDGLKSTYRSIKDSYQKSRNQNMGKFKSTVNAVHDTFRKHIEPRSLYKDRKDYLEQSKPGDEIIGYSFSKLKSTPVFQRITTPQLVKKSAQEFISTIKNIPKKIAPSVKKIIPSEKKYAEVEPFTHDELPRSNLENVTATETNIDDILQNNDIPNNEIKIAQSVPEKNYLSTLEKPLSPHVNTTLGSNRNSRYGSTKKPLFDLPSEDEFADWD